jgi:hypothetical protein
LLDVSRVDNVFLNAVLRGFVGVDALSFMTYADRVLPSMVICIKGAVGDKTAFRLYTLFAS